MARVCVICIYFSVCSYLAHHFGSYSMVLPAEMLKYQESSSTQSLHTREAENTWLICVAHFQ